MEFSKRLNTIIQHTGLLKKDFVKKSGVSSAQLFNYLKGEQEPNAKFFRRVSIEFPDINLNWLISGTGSMIIERQNIDSINIETENTEPPISESLTMTARVLESGTTYAIALRLNIEHFYRAIEAENKLKQLEQKMMTFEDRIKKLELENVNKKINTKEKKVA